MATAKLRPGARTNGSSAAFARFCISGLTVHRLREAGYSLTPFDGIGGSVLELRSASGSLVDSPDGFPARVEFDDTEVLAAVLSVGGLERSGFTATFDDTGRLVSVATH